MMKLIAKTEVGAAETICDVVKMHSATLERRVMLAEAKNALPSWLRYDRTVVELTHGGGVTITVTSTPVLNNPEWVFGFAGVAQACELMCTGRCMARATRLADGNWSWTAGGHRGVSPSRSTAMEDCERALEAWLVVQIRSAGELSPDPQPAAPASSSTR